jgi:hypothetical protein
MGKQRIKPNYRRRVLRLPDLDHSKTRREAGELKLLYFHASLWPRLPVMMTC